MKEIRININLMFKLLFILQVLFLLDTLYFQFLNLPILLTYLPMSILLLPILIIGVYVYVQLIMGKSLTLTFSKEINDGKEGNG